MRKWVKRIFFTLAILAVGLLALLYGGVRMIRGTPAWYRRYTASAVERRDAAQRAENKFVGIQNAAALARRDEIVARGTSHPSTTPAGEIAVSFTDDELNAFFQKWASFEDWKSNYDQYIDEPGIMLQDKRIIFAAQVKSLDTLASVHLEPQLDEQGRLDLRLTDILGGRLSLPEAIISPYKQRLIAALQSRLPRWRSQAAIDANGAANGDLIAASMARLAMHMLDHTSADPVLYLPLVERHSNVPVRITAVHVQEHVITITVRPLDSAGRNALLERVRSEEPTP